MQEGAIEQDETIAAISTPMGEGGIGIVRLSGRTAVKILIEIFRGTSGKPRKRFESHKVNFGHIVDDHGRKIDQVLATVMLSPLTYTREDVVEISCHGGGAVLKKVLARVLAAGARMANPGEFSKRAYLNGRIDLIQAEAIIDLIKSKSEKGWLTAFSQLDGKLSQALAELENGLIDILAQLEASIDFPEDEIEIINNDLLTQKMQKLKYTIDVITKSYVVGRVYREGVAVAIAGRPNVGKSSLMNALLNRERAIVTPHPGTTRDIIEETLHLEGIAVRIIDTAGIRSAQDPAEAAGINRAIAAAKDADIVLVLFDGSAEFLHEDEAVVSQMRSAGLGDTRIIPVINKSDLEQKIETSNIEELMKIAPVNISAKSGAGINQLLKRINNEIDKMGEQYTEGPILTRERHQEKLMEIGRALTSAITAVNNNLSREYIAADLQEGKEALEELTGKVVDDSVIERIFNEFCIGK